MKKLMILLLSTLLFLSCMEKEPVKIGFSSWLSGKNSVLGIAGRNAVVLAVEEINKSGGIKGRPVELIIKDDEGDAENALKVDKELIDAGCALIIGHMTSAMSLAVLSLVNEEQIIMISPTASSEELSGRDDYFFRIAPQSSREIQQLSEYASKTLRLGKMIGVYDEDNKAFTEKWKSEFDKELLKNSSSLVAAVGFNSKKNPDYAFIADTILKSNADGILIVANSIDTALICQQLDKKGSVLPRFSSGWANSRDLISNGGKAVEGLTFAQARDLNSTAVPYQDFRELYRKRYGGNPDIASIYSFEAAELAFAALRDSKNRKDLKRTIESMKSFQGLQTGINLDAYGDNQQEQYYILEIRNGDLNTISR